jgi:predicted DCC family thiol-disulfide oxidoreductase YuxK
MNNMALDQIPSSPQQLTVYFDGLCHLCSREINHYRKNAFAERLRFVDITESQFNPTQEGVDPFAVHRSMHVKRPNGDIIDGVDAFIEIWRTLPGYLWLAQTVSLKPVHALAKLGYSVFAKIRPLLPRKSRDCEESPYCEIHR